MTYPVREVITAAYRWRLPVDPGSVDYDNLRSWSERSQAVEVLVRGASLRGTSQELFGNVTVRTAPLGGLPGAGVPAYAVWMVATWFRLGRAPLVRLQASDPVGAAVTRLCGWLRRPGSRVVHVQGPYLRRAPALGRRGLVHTALQRFGAGGTAVVRTASFDAAGDALAAGIPSGRVVATWPLTDVRSFAKGPVAAASYDGEELVVLYVGSLVDRKGVDLLIEACARLDGVRLVIGGDGDERANLEALAAARGVRAEFVGYVPHDELANLLATAPVFALPSRSDAAPRAVMEAMAAGQVAVVSDVGDLPLIVGEAGRVVPSDDVAALSDALRTLRDDVASLRDLGERARDRALTEFDIQARSDELWRVALPAKRRLLFVLPALDRAGSEHFTHTLYLARSMAAARPDIEVRVVALRPASSPHASRPGVMVQYPGASWRSRCWVVFTELWRLRRGDIVYARISMGALALALLLRRPRRYQVAFWHSTWQEGLRAKVLTRKDRVFAQLARRVDHFVTYPASLAEFYGDWYGVPNDAVRLVPNNVDMTEEEPMEWPATAGDGPRLLFVGRLSERKGAHHLPTIGAEVARRLPGSAVVVAGDGPLRADAEGCAGLLLLGAVSNRSVVSLMRQADVVLQPSVAEGCSRVLQEAMALGTPVVFYDIPPSVDVAGGPVAAALAVPTGDTVALVERVQEVLDMTPEKRASLSALLQRRAEAYTNAAVAQSLQVELGL